jgi:4-hydroxy-2-oxoheptanedioate aldolase
MIETPAGVAAASEIARTPGLDGLYIGPSDLALSHGMPPTYTVRDARHRELIERVIAVGRSAGILVGLHCPTVREALTWADSGVTMLTAASDVILLRQGLADVADVLRRTRQ